MKLNSTALSISAILTVVFVVFLTITAELSSSFKGILVALAGHHWVAKGILMLLFFVLTYLVFKGKEESIHVDTWSIRVIIAVFLGGLTIFIFNTLVFLEIL